MLNFNKLSFIICALIVGMSFPTSAEIAAGDNFTLAVDRNGDVWVFGTNDKGQLGLGEIAQEIEPSPVRLATFANISKITAGRDHAVAIDNDGQVWVWGQNDHGQLGLGDRIARRTPTLIEGFSGAIQAAAGWFHTLILDRDGNVWSFGYKNFGALGYSNQADQLIPKRVDGLPNIIQIAAGTGHSVALDVDGNVWTFGENTDGQLGLGKDIKKYRAQPTMVKKLSKIAKIAAGGMQTFAIGEDNQVFGFGNNQEFQLAILPSKLAFITTNNNAVIKSPKLVPELKDITEITTSMHHTIALNQEGQILAFGRSYSGSLGLGDNVEKPQETPELITIPADVRIVEVSAGPNHTVALDNNGQLWTFGSDARGALGHGEGKKYTSPKMIENLRVLMKVPSMPQIKRAAPDA